MRLQWPDSATPTQRIATEELVRRLHAEYPNLINSAIVFGSVARGEFSDDSDIDVLIVTDHLDPELEWEIWGIGARTSLDFDVILDLHVFSRAHWDRLRAEGRSLWHAVERDGVELTLEPASP